MNKIVDFVKGILMFESNEKMPVGLCSFENNNDKTQKVKIKRKKNKEMRLSELMDR